MFILDMIILTFCVERLEPLLETAIMIHVCLYLASFMCDTFEATSFKGILSVIRAYLPA